MQWTEPNHPIGHADVHFRQIKPDTWECGDKTLLDKAGSYFQRLFRYQRHEQAKLRQKELKRYGHYEHPYLICYPLNNWYQRGYYLPTFDDVERFPWLPLYVLEEPKFTSERKRNRYFEDIKTLTKFPYKKNDPEDTLTYTYLHQQ